MATLADCLKKLGIDDERAAAVGTAVEHYRADGGTSRDAVKHLLRDTRKQQRSVVDQIYGHLDETQRGGVFPVEAEAPPPPPPVEAQIPPVAADNQQYTSARHAMLDSDREARGLSQLNSPDRRSWEEALDTAHKNGVVDNAMRIAAEVNANPRALDDIQTAGLVEKAARLKNEHAALVDEIGKLSDPVDIATRGAELNRVEEEFDLLTAALRSSGSEKGRALVSQKLTLDRDYNLVSVLNRAKAAKGSELTKAERQKFEDIVKQLEASDKKVAELEGKLSDRSATSAVKKSRRTNYSKMTADEKDAELNGLYQNLAGLLRAGCLNS